MSYLKRVSLSVLLFLGMGAQINYAQEILQYEATRRTPNSVEISGCVSSLLSSVLIDQVKAKYLDTLKTLVGSIGGEQWGVYFIQKYSNVKNSHICLAFVYQAMTPELASRVLTILNVQSQETVQLETGESIVLTVKASMWQGFDEPLFGLGWNLNANDLVLWGGGLGVLLVASIIGFCCLIYYYLKKEKSMVLKALRTSKNKQERLDQNKN